MAQNPMLCTVVDDAGCDHAPTVHAIGGLQALPNPAPPHVQELLVMAQGNFLVVRVEQVVALIAEKSSCPTEGVDIGPSRPNADAE